MGVKSHFGRSRRDGLCEGKQTRTEGVNMGVPRGLPSERIPSEDSQPVPRRRNQARAIATVIALMVIVLVALLVLL
jgi:hypothetical protein